MRNHKTNTKEKVMSKATKMFIALIAAIAVLLGYGLTREHPTHCYVSRVVAHQGDTLWGIAKANCTGNSTTIMVDDIYKLNPQLKKRDLQVGESVNLPMKEGK